MELDSNVPVPPAPPQLPASGSGRLPHGQAIGRLGPYRLMAELGRGANGVVYRAIDERLRREVALKTIPGVVDEGSIQRFVREARASARLRHPGIVAVYGAEVVQGVRVIALELVLGGSLKQKLADGPLGARDAAKLVRDLALAVQAAHDAGIVHRDLKPANVLLEPDGRPRLTDFGLARDDQGPTLTATGQVLGTPAYMAPEQARGEAKLVGPATDVWGLGAILYECLAGRPPFKATTTLETVKLVLSKDPEPPSSLRTSKRERVHPDLDTIALKALEKDLARRYARASFVAEDLRRFLAGEPIGARPPGSIERTRRRLVRHPVRVALVVLAVVGAGALGGVVARGELARRAAQTAVLRAEERLKDNRSSDANVEAAVLELARDASATTVEALAERLDAVSSALREETPRTILAADTLGAPIEGLAVAIERWTALQGEDRLPRADARALNEAERRLLASRREKDPARSLRELVARAQERKLGAQRLLFARVACDALGRIGRVEGAAPLMRHLDAEQDEARAVHAASALLRIPSLEAIRHALHAQDRFGRHGPFGERLGRSVDLRNVDAFIEPKTARDFRDRAELRESAGRFADALADLTRAIELDPKDAAALQARALLHTHHGRRAQALADFARAIELDPKPIRYARRAGAKVDWNDMEGALADATRAVTLAPDDPTAWCIRGFAKIVRRDLEGAIQDCERAIELDPRFARAYMNCGTAYRENGDPARALEHGRRATELDPGSVEAWTNLGQTFEKRHEDAEALTCLSRAIELSPGSAESWAARGNLRIGMGDWKLADEDLSRALDLKPSLYPVWVCRATARRSLGDVKGGIADCTRAIELDPKRSEGWVNRALLKQDAHDLDGALADCERGLEIAPGEARLFRARGMIRGIRRDPQAMADLARSLELDPKDSQTWLVRGMINNREGAHEAAASDLARCVELAPTNALARSLLAHERLVLGDGPGAIEQATAAISTSPTFSQAWFIRGMARLRANDAEGAQDLERALELDPKADFAGEARRVLEQVRAARTGR